MKRAVPEAVLTEEQLHEVVDYYTQVDEFVFDVETVGKRRGNPRVNRVTWLGLGHGRRRDLIPMGHPLGEMITPEYSEKEPFWDPEKVGKRGKPLKQWRTVRYPATFTAAPEQLYPGQVFEALEPVFFGEARKIGHGVKFDLESLQKYYGGRILPPPYGDTLVLAHILNSTLRYGLKDITKRFYDHDYDQENIAKPDDRGENGIEIHAFSKAAGYLALDLAYTDLIWEEFNRLFDGSAKGLRAVRRLEGDILPVLLSMEDYGVPIDVKAMEELGDVLRQRLVEIEKSVFRAAGEVFNLGSTPQVRKFVYETRGHEPYSWTKGGKDGKNKQPSTKAGVIEAFSNDDPVIRDLLDHAKVSTLLGTFVGNPLEGGGYEGGLLSHVVDGRVHADFVQYGADTGRFSCRKPNLQNIPQRAKDESSKMIRKMFISDPGKLLVVADWSQIEYRILAHFSKDPTLVKAFIEGYDPHAATIALLLDKALEDVTPEERDIGKTTNFAEIYGAGPSTIAIGAGVSYKKAKEMKKEHQKRTPKVQTWKREEIARARSRRPVPYVQTITGRRRYLPSLLSKDSDSRHAGERQCINTKIQGTAADMIKIAMVRLHHELEANYGPEARMIIQVHDELVVMAPEEQVEDVRDTVQETMESVNFLDVPLVAEANIGETWSDAK